MTEDWAAVGEVVRARQRELKLSTAALARETGLSETTVRYIGQPDARHNRSALAAISAVLRWRYDHLTNVLRGEPHKNVRIKQAHLNSEIADLRKIIRAANEKIDTLLKESAWVVEAIGEAVPRLASRNTNPKRPCSRPRLRRLAPSKPLRRPRPTPPPPSCRGLPFSREGMQPISAEGMTPGRPASRVLV
jgi:hypothetical protein